MASIYQVLRCDRKRKKGGGVALLVCSIFSPVLIFKESVHGSYEILCVELEIDLKLICFVVVYRAPGCNTKKTEQLMKALSDSISATCSSIIAGDFNPPDIKWNNFPDVEYRTPCTSDSANSRVFLVFFTTHSLHQYVRVPIRAVTF